MAKQPVAHDTHSFTRDYLAVQVWKLGSTVIVLIGLFALGFRRKDAFLVRGQLDAPIAPVKWLGFHRPEPWTHFGTKWIIFLSIGMVVLLNIFGTVHLDSLGGSSGHVAGDSRPVSAERIQRGSDLSLSTASAVGTGSGIAAGLVDCSGSFCCKSLLLSRQRRGGRHSNHLHGLDVDQSHAGNTRFFLVLAHSFYARCDYFLVYSWWFQPFELKENV